MNRNHLFTVIVSFATLALHQEALSAGPTKDPLVVKGRSADNKQKNEPPMKKDKGIKGQGHVPGIKPIQADKVKRLMDTGASIILVNVLTADAYNAERITGSINIPFETLSTNASTLDKNKQIIVYSQSSSDMTSRNAFNILSNLGFKNVWVYEGGIAEWSTLGYPREGTNVISPAPQAPATTIAVGEVSPMPSGESTLPTTTESTTNTIQSEPVPVPPTPEPTNSSEPVAQ